MGTAVATKPPTRRRPPANDPVTRYALEVVGGRIPAGHLVRLACQRHLTDLERGPKRGLVWRPDKAANVFEFFESVLCLPDVEDESDEATDEDEAADRGGGLPFLLSKFQKFIVGSLFGWYRVDGQRRFRVAYIETGKGSGKTPLAAGIGLCGLIVDGRRGSQIYAAAVKLDQAKLTFTDAENMVRVSPELAELVADGTIDSHVNNLSVPSTGSFFRPISSEKKGLDGKRVYIGLIDELHEHDTNTVDEKIRAGTKGRRNALIFKITNSGFNKESVCWHNREMSRQILEGAIENDSWFAYVCHLDPCPACFEKGYRQPNPNCDPEPGAPACDRWDVEGPHWLKANPNLGVSITWEYLREQVAEALGMPSKQNIVRRLNFCEWTEAETIWIAADKWDACGDSFDLESLRGRECFIGVDLSSKIDLTSAVAVFPRLIDEQEIPIDLGLAPTHGDPDAAPEERIRYINFGIDIWPLFWLPSATLPIRVKRDRVPYDQWRDEKHLSVTTGPIIDQSVIFRSIEALSKIVLVQGLAFDPTNAGHLATWAITLLGKDRVFDIQQGFKHLSEPSKVFEALIVAGRFRHPRNKVMTWNVSNASIEENSWQDIRPVKTSPIKRIDGVIATILGLRLVILRPPKRAPSTRAYIFRNGKVYDAKTGEEIK